METDELFEFVNNTLADLAKVRHSLVELREELQKEREKSQWTEKSAADAKAIKQLFPDAVFVRRIMGNLELLDQNECIVDDAIRIPNVFPRLKNAQLAKLDDIIGGTE